MQEHFECQDEHQEHFEDQDEHQDLFFKIFKKRKSCKNTLTLRIQECIWKTRKDTK